jgi:hypothetical protein
MLAQVSTVVFTTGLKGRPLIAQFLALPSQQDTALSRSAHRTKKDTLLRPGYVSPAGRHEKLPAARAVNTSGKAGAHILHLPQGDESSPSGDRAASI